MPKQPRSPKHEPPPQPTILRLTIARRAFCPLCAELITSDGFHLYRDHVFCSRCAIPGHRTLIAAVALLSHPTLVRYIATNHGVRFFSPIETYDERLTVFAVANRECPRLADLLSSPPPYQEQ